MGCFLRTLMPDKPIKKFKNGAIVEIKFVPNAGKHVTTITLVYRGSLAVDETVKKSYYVESDQGTLIGKLNLQQTLEKFNLTHADWLDMGENKTHIFYLVRHGDAKHNKKIGEILISDNASTDRTPEICSRIAREDKRVIYSRTEQNIGSAANFRRSCSNRRRP